MSSKQEDLNTAVGKVNSQNYFLGVNFCIPFDPDILQGIYLKEVIVDVVEVARELELKAEAEAVVKLLQSHGKT